MNTNILNINQGTIEWHDFRSKGIGASEASIISGHLPEAWDSLYALAYRKTNELLSSMTPQSIERMQRGIELEPLARKAYEELTNIKMEPMCLVHKQHNFILCSLDGGNIEQSVILEIKCSGEKVYNKVAEGKIPDYYIPQLQHQLAVSGASKAHFWMYDPDKGGILMEVLPDEEFIMELIDREVEFWKRVQSGKRIFGGQLGSKIPIKTTYKVIHP
jgi:putative phage-type endonuclease